MKRLDNAAAPAIEDDNRWRCAWVDGREQCHYPGAISRGTLGGGPWYCRFHFLCGSAAEGRRFIEQSRGFRRGDPLVPVVPEEQAAA